jgi:Spy/CpxP family protein refolding chaperone
MASLLDGGIKPAGLPPVQSRDRQRRQETMMTTTTRRWSSLAGALALTLGLAGGAMAGPRGRGPEAVKERVAKMKQRLDLSDEQAQKIEAILTEAHAQGEADRTQTRQHRREVRERIQAVLTEEQKAKAAEAQKARRREP